MKPLGIPWKIFSQEHPAELVLKKQSSVFTVISLSWWRKSVQIEFLFSQDHTSVLQKHFTELKKKKKVEIFRIWHHSEENH